MRRRVSWPIVVLSYAVLAIALTWPLVRHLSDGLPGQVSGDTGVYVWNLWLFRHEILVHHRLPFFTTEILSLTPAIDLSLHNYTVFDDLLAFPLLPLWGPVAAYNLVYLIATVLSASTMYALAKDYCRSVGAAWLAGLLFAWSPVLVARGEAHLSLVTAAALPAFALAWRRWWRTGRFFDAVLAGLAIAWAAVSDPYYAVYCVMIAAGYAAAASWRVSRGDRTVRTPWLMAIDTMTVIVALIVVTILWTGGFDATVAGIRIVAKTLYTPVLVMSALLGLRLWLMLRPRFTFVPAISLSHAVRGAAGVTLGCVLPLAPLLMVLARRVAGGARFHAPTLWRSSPRGLDLLSLVMPNPNHPLAGGWLRPWLTAQPGGFSENVGSLTFVALAVIALAVWRYRFAPPRFWVIATIAFALLSLGPFIHIAGANTFVPGPWAFLRYVPGIASARMPARFATPMMMGLAVLFATSLAHVIRQQPGRRVLILCAVAAALIVELLPAPRTIYDARVPAVYQTIAQDPRSIRIMELPLGFRDGEYSYGDFSAASQFYQTFHEKRLIGGYLSRISRREINRQFRFSVVKALVTLSSGQDLTETDRAALFARAKRFALRARLGYVVVDRARTSDALRQIAIDAFGLVKLDEDRGYELYLVPGTMPALALASDQDLEPPPQPIAPIDR